MIGAIAGDIIGSIYEFNNYRSEDFNLFDTRSEFTDDTVLTVATADVLLNGGNYADKYREYVQRYPHCSYGSSFYQWAISQCPMPYSSFGNGSAMRVSPVGFAFNNLESVLLQAKRSAVVTHNHPEGIKGAQATAASIFLARKQVSKNEIKAYIEDNFQYTLDKAIDDLRSTYQFNETCQGTVPEAIFVFLISSSFEDCIRKAVSIGGDSDTLACIAGGIAEAYYGVPIHIATQVQIILEKTKLWDVVKYFRKKFME
jgi:ADP-ribosylglycohydrolase